MACKLQGEMEKGLRDDNIDSWVRKLDGSEAHLWQRCTGASMLLYCHSALLGLDCTLLGFETGLNNGAIPSYTLVHSTLCA